MTRHKLFCYLMVIGGLSLSPPFLVEGGEEIRQRPFYYQIDHKRYKSDKGAILYKDTFYVDARELARLLGLSIIKNQDTLYIQKVPMQKQELTSINQAIIKTVDKEKYTLTLLQREEEDKKDNYLTVYVNKNTIIGHTILGRTFPFEVLKEEMIVSITCSPRQTKNTYDATYIDIIDEDYQLNTQLPIIENAIITKIDYAKLYLTVKTNQNQANEMIMIHVDAHTNIKDARGKSDYALEALHEGLVVDIVTNGIMTQSTPPQTLGLEIVIKQ